MDTTTIALTQGMTALIDTHNLEWLAQWKWSVNEKEPGRYYAYRRYRLNGKNHLHMHREVLIKKLGRPLAAKEECDHINGNTLDNRECNLRPATRVQQLMNTAPRKGNRSRFKGVSYRGPSRPGAPVRARPWAARINLEPGAKELGYFATEEEAARAYNKAAALHFGEFARLNPA